MRSTSLPNEGWPTTTLTYFGGGKHCHKGTHYETPVDVRNGTHECLYALVGWKPSVTLETLTETYGFDKICFTAMKHTTVDDCLIDEKHD